MDGATVLDETWVCDVAAAVGASSYLSSSYAEGYLLGSDSLCFVSKGEKNVIWPKRVAPRGSESGLNWSLCTLAGKGSLFF